LVRRTFAESDVQKFGGRVSEYTVWIPDGGENDNLGSYMLAIGYVGTERVAAGELFDFHVTRDRNVWLYDLALHDYDASNIEEWGRPDTHPCLRYERARDPGQPAIVAIVREDDSDCDAFLDQSQNGVTDCEPLLYCDGSGDGDCLGRTPCLHDDNQCSIGSCSNKDGASVTCEDETCVSDVLCEQCDLSRSPAEILDCALLTNATHPGTDIAINVRGSQVLCADPTFVDITLPFPCRNPTVDAVSYFAASDPFTFAIDQGAAPKVCRLTIGSTHASEAFSGAPHLLVTVEIDALNRIGFVVGVLASTTACPQSNEPLVRMYAPNIGTCQPPEP
jgi:hypothetical protein